MSLTHIGRMMHGYANFVSIRCKPFSYLNRVDFVPLFDEGVITCFECLVDTKPMRPGDGAWREVSR